MSEALDRSKQARTAARAGGGSTAFAYIIADVTVTSEDQMKLYREWSTRAIQEHGAEVLVRGGRMEPLEGDWNPQRLVVLKFKDLASARAYYDSETYTQARKVREGAGSIRMLAVEGI
ncbi:MAG: DUF1330 domain-containing protein [Hydrogenophaga sp.]|uniref:DUF1330 domain-containing protein n=1 Tax=Hydrogenophaga sp. TaxID=1904254 RepID=UPI00271A89BC|nr:DUF1330 domain-containing protein [Hydrogenophaga sp.]MDO9147549.1 DUF1330 domain-containing protein [Hydrogenophaga sp.]MDO9606804.1 DUF1330 domain-containing protein [Hydrogenophaga sp.]MDP2416108.1 DUF1330 domain-containing protein [Hydrogenophaga sp.]